MSTARNPSLTNRAVPILAYHDFEAGSWKYSLDPVLFEEHLSYLQGKGYVVISLADYNHSGGVALSTKSLILTFNGAFNSIETVLPVLQKYKAKATIFVPSAQVGKKVSWMNMQNNAMTLLDWEALRNLSTMGFEIASHGHEHLQLDLAPEVLARHDISYSKIILEDNLGKACLSFAYPYGYYNTRVRDLVRSAGFSVACTLDEGVSTSESDLFTLPRLTMTSGLDIARLKNLITQKDSGQVSPYSFVKASISRQLRRWKTPLRESRLQIYDEPLSPDVKAPLKNPASPQQEELISEQPLSVPDPAETQLHSTRQGSKTLNLPNENPKVTEPQHPQETLPEAIHEESSPHNQTLSIEESQELEFQGEFLATCKAKLLAHPYEMLEEYQHLALITSQVQKAQENRSLFANFENLEYSYEIFGNAVQRHLETRLQTQKAQLQEHLSVLANLHNTPIQSSIERVKTLLASYVSRLEDGLLHESDLQSTNMLVKNLHRRLLSTYRRQLMQLVHQASKYNATDVLKTIQEANRQLDQEHYPDLEHLKQILNEKISQVKQAQQRKRKSEQFSRKLQELQIHFAPLSHLNTENVYNLRAILEHLEAQHLSFHEVSDGMQEEFMHLLKEARHILGQLQKEQQTTMKIAGHILASESFNSLFSTLNDSPPALPQSPDNPVKRLGNLN